MYTPKVIPFPNRQVTEGKSTKAPAEKASRPATKKDSFVKATAQTHPLTQLTARASSSPAEGPEFLTEKDASQSNMDPTQWLSFNIELQSAVYAHREEKVDQVFAEIEGKLLSGEEFEKYV